MVSRKKGFRATGSLFSPLVEDEAKTRVATLARSSHPSICESKSPNSLSHENLHILQHYSSKSNTHRDGDRFGLFGLGDVPT